MTAKEARSISASKALEGIDEIYILIRARAEEGHCNTLLFGELKSSLILELEVNGYVVSDYTIGGVLRHLVSWEL
jgi:hypothetical protein